MPYKLNISEQAQKNSRQIVNYIKYALLNPQASDSFIDALEKRYIKILQNPHGFSAEWINNKLYRKTMVKKYVVLFRIDEQAHTVHIIAIGHSLRKRKNIIKE